MWKHPIIVLHTGLTAEVLTLHTLLTGQLQQDQLPWRSKLGVGRDLARHDSNFPTVSTKYLLSTDR